MDAHSWGMCRSPSCFSSGTPDSLTSYIACSPARGPRRYPCPGPKVFLEDGDVVAILSIQHHPVHTRCWYDSRRHTEEPRGLYLGYHQLSSLRPQMTGPQRDTAEVSHSGHLRRYPHPHRPICVAVPIHADPLLLSFLHLVVFPSRMAMSHQFPLRALSPVPS